MENGDKYLPELLAEKDSLDSSFTHAMKLLNAGKVDSLFNSGRECEVEGTDDVRAKEHFYHPVSERTSLPRPPQRVTVLWLGW